MTLPLPMGEGWGEGVTLPPGIRIAQPIHDFHVFQVRESDVFLA